MPQVLRFLPGRYSETGKKLTMLSPIKRMGSVGVNGAQGGSMARQAMKEKENEKLMIFRPA